MLLRAWAQGDEAAGDRLFPILYSELRRQAGRYMRRERRSHSVSCKVTTGQALVEAGLHPATGGTGLLACSGDMLLEALVACAGVTLGAVATAMGIAIDGGTVTAEGDLDFRGTLGVARDVPVGFRAIRLTFGLQTTAPPEQLAKLLELTERYCVVYQTLAKSPPLTVTHRATP